MSKSTNLFIGLLAVSAAASCAWLYAQGETVVTSTVPAESSAEAGQFAYRQPVVVAHERRAEVPVDSAETEKPADVPTGKLGANIPDRPAFAAPEVPVDESTCLAVGPVPQAELPAVRRALESAGLLNRVWVEEIGDEERFRVSAGPFKTAKQAAKAAKLLKTEAIDPSRTERAEGYFLELHLFEGERYAADWAKAVGTKLRLSNLRVERVVLARSPGLRLTFRNLSSDENQRVRRFAREIGKAGATACTPD